MQSTPKGERAAWWGSGQAAGQEQVSWYCRWEQEESRHAHLEATSPSQGAHEDIKAIHLIKVRQEITSPA